jgi:hypothetical protein
MSKLKVHKIGDLCFDFKMGKDVGIDFYLKSEADKVIAELKADYKEACDRLQTANLIKDEQLAAVRHHKYKRCLDKADYWGLLIACTHGLIQLKCMRRETKWRKLAEKFKEAK